MATVDKALLSDTERRVLDRFATLLGERLGSRLRAIWLYGSRARGEDTGSDSDVDLLIVTSGGRPADAPVVNQAIAEAAHAERSSPFAFSTIVMSPERLRQRREIDSFFIRAVDRDRIVLRGEQ